jgi:hypothetical protein
VYSFRFCQKKPQKPDLRGSDGERKGGERERGRERV